MVGNFSTVVGFLTLIITLLIESLCNASRMAAVLFNLYVFKSQKLLL
ncbi:hypothetical protein [Anaerobacillus alkalidiazotrophicus]|nr:hypothetical protein [Anaerobacillus alkalidiazotrophicus]